MGKLNTWDSLVFARPWTEELEKRIDDYVRRGDSVNIWGLPALGTSLQLRKLVKESKSNTVFAYIDTQWLSPVTSESFFNLINTKLCELCGPKATQSLSSTPSSTLYTRQLIHCITEDKPLCMIIDTIEQLTTLDKSFFSTFKALRDEFISQLTFIFVSNRPLYDHPQFTDKDAFVDFACHIEHVSVPLPDEQLPNIIKLLQVDYGRSFSDDEIKAIVPICGGNLGLLKHVLRLLDKDSPENIDEDAIFNDHTIYPRLARILEAFNPQEREYLYEIARKRPPKTTATVFLQKSGVLEKGKIRGTLMRRIVIDHYRIINGDHGTNTSEISDNKRRKSRGLAIDLISGEIEKDGKRLPESLSKTEVQIIQELQERRGELVTKEEIAQKIWGGTYKEKYSEWAIDKAISRIRQKLGDTQRPYRYLITIKGRGFKLYHE